MIQRTTNLYQFDQYGILPLSPQTKLNIYSKTISWNFSLSFLGNNKFDIYFDFEPNEKLIIEEFNSDKNQWTIDIKILDSENSVRSCLDINWRYFISFKDGDKYCEEQIKKICKNLIDCDKNQADLN